MSAITNKTKTSEKNIEAIYPLTPTQQLVLLHSLYNRSDDSAFIQVSFTLEGELNCELFKKSWDYVVARHPVLRSSIHWGEFDKVLQVVHKRVAVPWEMSEWENESNVETSGRIPEVLQQDRITEFEFSDAPLIRLALIRTNKVRYHFTWSCHHTLLDGWSGALVLKEVFACYVALRHGKKMHLDSVRPYKDYVIWLEQQEKGEAEKIWKRILNGNFSNDRKGYRSHTQTSMDSQEFNDAYMKLSSAKAKAIESLARRFKVTLSTMITGAWGLLLARINRSDKTVLGVTLSGRSVPLDGIEGMIGLFANTLPLPIDIDSTRNIADWYYRLNNIQRDIQKHEYIPVTDIHEWSGIQGSSRLFDSIVVFQNYPIDDFQEILKNELLISNYASDVTSIYPISLVVIPGAELCFRCRFSSCFYKVDIVNQTLTLLKTLFEKLLANPNQRVGELLAEIGDNVGETLVESNESSEQLSNNEPVSSQPSIKEDFAVGRTDVEHQLTLIWEDILDYRPLAVNDNFFDIGGDSMSAIRMFTRIEAEFSTRLLPTTIFEAPTIRQLAAKLSTRGVALQRMALVPIQPNGKKPILFCIHALWGAVFHYRNLVKYLGIDQPLYGLQAVGYDCLEDMSSYYIEQVRSLQPNGPYYLLGNCNGGLIAFEMAHQLITAGEKVPFLCLIDTPPTMFRARNFGNRGIEILDDQIARLIYHYLNKDMINTVARKSTQYVRKISTLINRETRYDKVAGDIDEENSDPNIAGVMKAVHRYRYLRRHRYPGKLLCFSAERTDHSQYSSLNWRKLACDGADIRRLPCEHTEILREPNLRYVCAQLIQMLHNTREKTEDRR